jgi:hypothetical protein
VRGALTPADGFSNVQTDIANNTCQFNYSKSEAELTAKLDELAKANEHIRDWMQLRERPYPWARITWLGAGSLLVVVAIWSVRRRRLFRDAEHIYGTKSQEAWRK